MPTVWVLSGAVAVLVAIALVVALRDPRCSDSDDGDHEWVHETLDSASGRRWRRVCLHCGRHTPGIEIAWIR